MLENMKIAGHKWLSLVRFSTHSNDDGSSVRDPSRSLLHEEIAPQTPQKLCQDPTGQFFFAICSFSPTPT